jgi:hypothetical protein
MTDSFMRNKRFFISSQAFTAVACCDGCTTTGCEEVDEDPPNKLCPIPNPIPDPMPEVTEFMNKHENADDDDEGNRRLQEFHD